MREDQLHASATLSSSAQTNEPPRPPRVADEDDATSGSPSLVLEPDPDPDPDDEVDDEEEGDEAEDEVDDDDVGSRGEALCEDATASADPPPLTPPTAPPPPGRVDEATTAA